jgi:hypothetical protein
LISLGRCLADIAGRWIGREDCCAVKGLQRSYRNLGYSSSRAEALKASRLATSDRTIGLQSNMTYLTGITIGPAIDVAIQNEASSHAGSEGEERHVLATFSSSEAKLSQCTGVSVVIKKRWNPKPILKDLGYLNILP